MLDGTTNAKDARLVAAIEAADPFDGGCPADVEAPAGKVTDRIDWPLRDRIVKQATINGRMQGITDVVDWLRDMGRTDSASIIARDSEKIAKFIRDRSAKGD